MAYLRVIGQNVIEKPLAELCRHLPKCGWNAVCDKQAVDEFLFEKKRKQQFGRQFGIGRRHIDQDPRA